MGPTLLPRQIFYALNRLFKGTFCSQISFRLLQVTNKLQLIAAVDFINQEMSPMSPFSPKFRPGSTKHEPLSVSFCTFLNADISGARKVIKKRSTAFFPVFP